MRVLVVEDDAALRELWLDAFRQAGHVGAGASSFAEAEDALHLSPFDVVVLDLFLGTDLGLSLATLASYANPHCRIIVVTGSGLFAKGELFEISPLVTSVLRKPVRTEDLLAVSEHDT